MNVTIIRPSLIKSRSMTSLAVKQEIFNGDGQGKSEDQQRTSGDALIIENDRISFAKLHCNETLMKSMESVSRQHRKRRSSSRRLLLLGSGSNHERSSNPTLPFTTFNRETSNGSFSMGTSSFDYTEHTYQSLLDDDNLLACHEFADSDGNVDGWEDVAVEESSVALSSSEGCWNSDDGIVYHSDSENPQPNRPQRRRQQQQQPFHTVLSRQSSRMSLSAHTLSTTFSLDDLGSPDTVSSLEDEDGEDDIEDDEFPTDALITVDGVGLLNLGVCSPTVGQSLSPKRNKNLHGIAKAPDTVNDLCSLDSTDQKLRHFEQKVVTHLLRNAFSHKLRGRRKISPSINDELGRHHGDSSSDDEGFIEEVVDEEEEEIIVEEILEEVEEEVAIKDDYDVEVRRVFSKMHQSMVISTPQRIFKTHHHHHHLSAKRPIRANRSFEELTDIVPRKYALDDLDERTNVGEDFPSNVGTAKLYLAHLAHERLTPNIPTERSKASSRTPSQDGSAMHSSDEYTEILVSSDDSFVDEEEEILEEIVASSLPPTPSHS
jgi:hypothetical protein